MATGIPKYVLDVRRRDALRLRSTRPTAVRSSRTMSFHLVGFGLLFVRFGSSEHAAKRTVILYSVKHFLHHSDNIYLGAISFLHQGK